MHDVATPPQVCWYVLGVELVARQARERPEDNPLDFLFESKYMNMLELVNLMHHRASDVV